MKFNPFSGNSREPASEQVPSQVTLAAAAYIGKPAESNLETRARLLARAFSDQPDTDPASQLLNELAGLRDRYDGYVHHTLGVETTAFAAVRQEFEGAATNSWTERLEGLKMRLKGILAHGVRGRTKLSEELEEVRREERCLAIGILGNPDLQFRVPGVIEAYSWFVILLLLGTVIDFGLNLELMEYGSNLLVARIFSLVMSGAGAAAAWWAAKSYRTWRSHRNAQVALRHQFGPNQLDVDGTEISVLPLDAGFKVEFGLSHGFLFLIATALAAVRLYIILHQPEHNLVGFAATFAVMVVWALIYFIEIKRSGVEHPRLRELGELRRELEFLEVRVNDFHVADETREEVNRLVEEFRHDAAEQAKTSRAAVVDLLRRQGDIRRLLNETRSGSGYFLDLGQRLLGILFRGIIAENEALARSSEYNTEPARLRKLVEATLGKASTVSIDGVKPVLDYRAPSLKADNDDIDPDAIVSELLPELEHRERESARRARTAEARRLLSTHTPATPAGRATH